MVDLALAYANARVKAMKSRLLDEEKIRALLAVDTLNGVVGLLEESTYKDAFIAESTRHKGIELVVKALERDLNATLRKIRKISPRKMWKLLDIFLKQWDVNNLKIIISSKALGRPVAQSDLLLADAGPAKARFFQRLLACGSAEEVARALSKTAYGPAVNKALAEYGKSRDYRVFLAALDYQWYNSIVNSGAGADAGVREFVGRKIDALNALTILRLKQAGASPEKIGQFIVVGGSKRLASELLKCEGMQKAVEAACAKLGIGKAVADRFRTRGSLAELELEIERKMVERARKTMARSVMSPAAIIGYLHLKDYEVQSLRKIAFATLFDMKDDVRGTIVAAG